MIAWSAHIRTESPEKVSSVRRHPPGPHQVGFADSRDRLRQASTPCHATTTPTEGHAMGAVSRVGLDVDARHW